MATADTQHERREVYYSGRVQGVGFRYTANRLAGNHEVAGFVRNLPDGRVHLVVEGARLQVGAFLAAIDDSLGDYIRDAAIDLRPATGKFTRFEVRY